jgi:hypothetical protein
MDYLRSFLSFINNISEIVKKWSYIPLANRME